MQQIYALNENDKRKLKFLYHQSGMGTRYSVIPDYSRPVMEWKFYPPTENLEPFPSLEQRMDWYSRYAGSLSHEAVHNCLAGRHSPKEITHLITVSCTGLSAPGLDLELLDLLDLPNTTFRTSINFMGCYAAVHALKLADAFCTSDPRARVLVVCTELCTLHFQREPSMDNIASSLLFGDGSAAVLIVGDHAPEKGMHLKGFYSEVISRGRNEMAWELSSTGFRMVLSNYVPDLIKEDFRSLAENTLERNGVGMEEIDHWCIHPGGKKILDAAYKNLQLTNGHLDECYEVLKEYGNMSSATILFVLKRVLDRAAPGKPHTIFGAAFGPGLTMETFIGKTEE
jgi:predicted naringenin-chalcone synthase